MKKELPLFYLIIAAVLISYGWWLTFFLKNSNDYIIISKLNIVSIFITLFWIVLNICFIGYMGHKGFGKFQREALIIPIYYFMLNTLNALNLHFGWIADYNIHFVISLCTKSFETVVVGGLIYRRLKNLKH